MFLALASSLETYGPGDLQFNPICETIYIRMEALAYGSGTIYKRGQPVALATLAGGGGGNKGRGRRLFLGDLSEQRARLRLECLAYARSFDWLSQVTFARRAPTGANRKIIYKKEFAFYMPALHKTRHFLYDILL